MLSLNSENDVPLAYRVVTEILSYIEQQNDKGISYEDKYHNTIQYLIKQKSDLKEELDRLGY